MPIRVELDDLARGLLSAEERGPEFLADAVQAIGVTLQSLEADNFERKSGGGTGTDGVTWDRLSEFTVQKKGSNVIGVETGLMRSTRQLASRVIAESGRVTLAYTQDYAPDFDENRPLLPEALPAEWQAEIEEVAGGLAEDWLTGGVGA